MLSPEWGSMWSTDTKESGLAVGAEPECSSQEFEGGCCPGRVLVDQQVYEHPGLAVPGSWVLAAGRTAALLALGHTLIECPLNFSWPTPPPLHHFTLPLLQTSAARPLVPAAACWTASWRRCTARRPCAR